MSYEALWRFETKRFAVEWRVMPCYDLDLSWDDDDGEVTEKLQSGFFTAFDSEIVVLFDDLEIGSDYLGQSIYENPSEFRDHIGMRAKGHGSYFSDMVRSAIRAARQELARMQAVKLRTN